jgi:hypothetical protein
VICLVVAVPITIVCLSDKPYMPYIAIPVGLVAFAICANFLRQLQLVPCPKCGQAFMDQDGTLLLYSAVVYKVLFKLRCRSCGAHRWLD